MEILWKVKFRTKNGISHTFVVTLLIHTCYEKQGIFKQSLIIIKAPCCGLFLYVLFNPIQGASKQLPKEKQRKLTEKSLEGKNHMTLKQLVEMKILDLKWCPYSDIVFNKGTKHFSVDSVGLHRVVGREGGDDGGCGDGAGCEESGSRV